MSTVYIRPDGSKVFPADAGFMELGRAYFAQDVEEEKEGEEEQ